MKLIMEYWLSIAAAVFLLAMVLRGHHKGFLKMAVSMTALVLSLMIVRQAQPHVTALLKDKTGIHQVIGQGLLKLAGTDEETEGANSPAQQREVIKRLKLPEQMKEALLENNNNEIYGILGVDAFLDYLGIYLANMILNLVGAIILFVLVYFGIHMAARWLNIIARLPILSGINQIAGAVLGGCQGLLFLWVAGLAVKACSGMPWTQGITSQIQTSSWLLFLYKNNIFNWLFMSILNALA